METKDPIEKLRDELGRGPLFRKSLLELLDEIEAQYMRLPVDADGVPIRQGDRVEGYEQADVRVEGIAHCGVIVRSNVPGGHGYPDTSYPLLLWANEKVRHVKHDTVEGVVAEAMNLACEPESPYSVNSKHVREFAERIRKAVE